MMSKNYAFTICTKSYIGLAWVLRESLLKYNSDFNFYIFVADENDDETRLPDDTYIIKDLKVLSDEKWIECAFKYNVTEFCTCLKPFICKWLLENTDAEKVFYMDPDLFFFSDAQPLLDGLNGEKIIELTPHFLTFPETKQSKYFEDEIRYSGIFNLGFLGIKRNDKVLKMLSWWGGNLLDKCFADGATFQFTDQKWMDFMPLFFNENEINVVRNLGWNVAPWNYFERKIIFQNDFVFVTDRNSNSNSEKIVFAHFSGFKYKDLLNDKVIQVNNGHENEYSDADELLNLYIAELKSKRDILKSYFSKNYTYANYDNGKVIEKFHRRLYRSFILNKFDFAENPFRIDNYFYKKLLSKKIFSQSKLNDIENLKNDNSYVIAKIKKVNIVFAILFKLLGYERYLTFCRFLHRYTKFENQLFLLNRDLISWV